LFVYTLSFFLLELLKFVETLSSRLTPKCSALSLAHLAFADDLFLLSGADCSSIAIFQSALDDFYLYSGLKPNLQKSQIFFSGVAVDLKRSLLAILPIPEGHLPVRYLGVPLISSRLRYEDCVVLKDRVLQRIMSWSNRLLSFGGRAQLIHSVLFNIQVYWCSLFILPQRILKEIEGMMRAFLWSGVDLKTTGAKVSWKDVCTPKLEGGLGFKPLKDWNKATMLRHLWPLARKLIAFGFVGFICISLSIITCGIWIFLLTLLGPLGNCLN
jgi:hypothetical protein